MQQQVYECRTNSVSELKQRLIDIWHSLQQNIIDAAINERRKRLMHVQMDSILHTYCKLVIRL